MSDFSVETLLQRSEYGDAHYPVAIADPDRAGNSLARRMTRAILREVLGRLSFGVSLPSDHVADDLFYLTAAGTLETYTKKLIRTGETSSTVSDFDDDEVGIYSNVFRMAADATDAAFFTALGSGDKIILHPESGSDVVLSLSGAPTTGSRNSHATVNVASSDYTLTGTIEDDTAYTVYAITSRSEVKGSIFVSDGVFWRRELDNTGSRIADDSVTLAKLASGTAGNMIGYDSGGDPADVGGGHLVALLAALTGSSRLSYTSLKDQLTGVGLVTLLAALTGASRLSYTSLKDTPTIPVDTTLWRGTYAVSTAYAAGDIVLHSGDLFLFTASVADTNTETDPGNVAGAEQIDVGAAGDVTGVSESAGTVTVTKRDGTTTTFSLQTGADPFKVSAISDTLTALAGADHFVVSDESAANDPNKKITWTNLVAAIVAALTALTGTNRLSYHGLKSVPTYGGSFPASPVADDIHILTADSSTLRQFTAKVPRTVGGSLLSLGASNVAHIGGIYYLGVGSDAAISDLGIGDQIVHVRNGVKQTLTLTAGPQTVTTHGATFITLACTDYTRDGSFTA